MTTTQPTPRPNWYRISRYDRVELLIDLGNRLKDADEYELANLVWAEAVRLAAVLSDESAFRLEYETASAGHPEDEDWSDRLDDDGYHDLVVLVADMRLPLFTDPSRGKRLCIPVPLVAQEWLAEQFRLGTLIRVARRKHGGRDYSPESVTGGELEYARSLFRENCYPLKGWPQPRLYDPPRLELYAIPRENLSFYDETGADTDFGGFDPVDYFDTYGEFDKWIHQFFFASREEAEAFAKERYLGTDENGVAVSWEVEAVLIHPDDLPEVYGRSKDRVAFWGAISTHICIKADREDNRPIFAEICIEEQEGVWFAKTTDHRSDTLASDRGPATPIATSEDAAREWARQWAVEESEAPRRLVSTTRGFEADLHYNIENPLTHVATPILEVRDAGDGSYVRAEERIADAVAAGASIQYVNREPDEDGWAHEVYRLDWETGLELLRKWYPEEDGFDHVDY